MTSIAIVAVAICCLVAFVVAVQAAREIELAKLTAASNFVELPSGELVIPAGMKVTAPACPCRNLTSLTVGSVHELPPGTVIPPAAEADPRVVSITETPINLAASYPEFAASFSVKATEEVKSALDACAIRGREAALRSAMLSKASQIASPSKSQW